MIDNFKILKELITNYSSLEKDDFLFVQILKRKKENPDMKYGVSLIETYFLTCLEDFDLYYNDIVKSCVDNNARAYIRLNKRNNENIILHMIKELSDNIINNNFKIAKSYEKFHNSDNLDDKDLAYFTLKEMSIALLEKDYSKIDKRISLSICGRYNSEKIKKWMIDLDDKSMLDEIINFIKPLTDIYGIIPTKNGYHIITRGFNTTTFKIKYPSVMIDKDANTILYI